MKMKLESIVKKAKKAVIAGLLFSTMSCASSRFYIGPKVGVTTPLSEKEQTYESSATIGGALGIVGERVGMEFGLDYFHSSGNYIETSHFLSDVNLNLNLSKPTAKTKLYLLGGAGLLSESSIISIPKFRVHDEMESKTFGIEFGTGITIIDRIDGRITYITMPESENVKGMITITGGYRFSFERK